MLVSENWLREWVNPDLPIEQIAETLTMAGLEVDSIHPQSPEFSDVVVAQVLSVEPHPDAKKLKLCQLDDGSDESIRVVCGADNVSRGIKVPLARVGARLPDEVKIGNTRIRGVESLGMICSAMELGLAEKSDGIMRLDDTAIPGTALEDHLQLPDRILELELTPNRGDCLGIAGVARELAALTDTRCRPVGIEPVVATSEIQVPVKIMAPEGCPRYVARIIESIDPAARTPDWMKEKLRRCGIRPISCIVDITNFVMIEIGQPMHAFDLENLDKGIVVRNAEKGESLTLLDEKDLNLQEDDLLICDHGGPVALAGIMGGMGSGISSATKSVLLESAYFSQEKIIGKARRIGIQTDASYRFERGVDPYLQEPAIQRATQLILDICGGQPGPVIERADHKHVPVKQSVAVRYSQINKVIGLDVKPEQAHDYLTRLGCVVETGQAALKVTPPAFRFDLEYEHDLIEEIARLFGYNRIPENPPNAAAHSRGASESRIAPDRIKDLMIDRGYQEAITYSFVDSGMQENFNPIQTAVTLENPISDALSEMRLSLLPGLLNCLVLNYHRQHRHIRLFEVGNAYKVIKNQRHESHMLGAISTGSQFPEQWGRQSGTVDFYDIKSDFEAIAMLSGGHRRYEFTADSLTGFHPGRCAKIYVDGSQVGIIGQILPAIAAQYDVDQDIYYFEVGMNAISKSPIPFYRSTSKFPSTRRDLSIIVDQQVTAQALIDNIRESAGDDLVELKLFDVYTGKPIDSNQKSVSIGLTFQALERTLTEGEMDETCQRVMGQLNYKFNAKLRN